MSHAEREHALLSASAANRWLNCTPSARLEEQLEDTTSEYAIEGTLAHEISELKLKRKFMLLPQKAYTTAMNKLKKHDRYQDEMQGYTDIYLDYVSEIIYGLPTKPYFAFEKRVDYSTYAQEGFGTADCIIIHSETMRVIDFKYGKGVPVSAEHNPQMMLYALGAICELGFIYPIKKVVLSIVQPRLDTISEWEIDIANLIDFGNSVIPQAQKAWLGVGEFVSGDYCKFCRAKATCRARADDNLRLAQHEFKKPPLLTNAEVGQILLKAQNLVKWASDLEAFALAELLKGNTIDGWKAVEGRSNRTFADTDVAFDKLKASGIDGALLYERRPLTLTAVEKLVGKKVFDEILSDGIIKPQGKPTLALETDARERFSLKSAQSDFAAENKNEEEK